MIKNRRKLLAFKHSKNPHCRYCGVLTFVGWGYGKTQATLDHKIPKSLGGGNEHRNLILACAECNLKKGNLTQEQFNQLTK